MKIGISRRDSGVRRNGKFYFPNFQLLPFRCKSESPAEIPAFAGMENFIFLISNFYHSDVNRNLRRDSGVRRNGKFFFPNFQLLPFRCKSESPPPPLFSPPPPLFLADKIPPSRCHSRERGNPFLPTNSRVHAVFCEKNVRKFQT